MERSAKGPGSRFFWKLYLTFVALVVVTLTTTGFLVHGQLEGSLRRDVEARLHDVASALTLHAAEVFERLGAVGPTAGGGYHFDPEVQRQVVRIGEQNGLRLTFVALDGWVVADSESDPSTMDNHAGRPEIIAALAPGASFGVSQRFSATVEDDLLNVAMPVRDGRRTLGTVRASIPLSVVDAHLAAMRRTVALGAGLGILVALGVGLFVAKRITSPISEMTDVAEALRAGDYHQRVERLPDDEIGLLGATINSLADELAQRIATLAEQRAQLGAMIAGMHEAVFAVDDDNRLIFKNKAARKLLRLDKAATEEPVWNLIDVPGLEKMCTKAAESGRRAKKEITINRDGAEMILEARANSFEGDGQRGVVVVMHDVTALRRLERMRTEFVANVSHELKTPLTSIRGYVETLIGGAIHDDAHNLSFLGKINQQVDRLTAMVQDVLALARIESMDARLATQPTDWRAIVERVVDDYRQAGRLQRHRFSLQVPDGPLYVDGEEESMTQVLDNLLDNALKYTPAGGEVTVRLTETPDQIELEVVDTGIGMSHADRARIFERFFRTDRARSRDTGGTGLGLAIVKHLVQSLGGEVRVESALGEGSRFLVSLPRSVAEEELPAAV